MQEPRTAEEIIARAKALRDKLWGTNRPALVRRELVRPNVIPKPAAAPPPAEEKKRTPKEFTLDPALYDLPAPARVKFLARDTAERWGFRVEDLYGKRSGWELAACRREWLWLVCTYTRMTYMQIARLVGRDHSTIINSVTIQDELCGTDVRSLRARHK